MLGQTGILPECIRGFTVVVLFNPITPRPRLQRVDDILSVHQLQIAAVQIFGKFPILSLRIQSSDCLATFPKVGQQQLEQIGLTLPAVADEEGAAVGAVVRPPIKIHQDMRPIFVPTQAEAMGIGLARIAQRVQICGGGGGQHPFILQPEHITAHRHHRQEPLPLP